MQIRGREDYRDLLDFWMSSNCVPQVISAADGRILWCNGAFEELLGYTEVEFRQGAVDWKSLTPDASELAYDEQLVAEMLAGTRRGYSLVKSYRTRNRGVVAVRIHVNRWPVAGEVELFLVTVLPLEGWIATWHEHALAISQQTRQQLEVLAASVQELATVSKSAQDDSDVLALLKPLLRIVSKYPKRTAAVLAGLTILILGDAGVTLVQRIVGLFGFVRAQAP